MGVVSNEAQSRMIVAYKIQPDGDVFQGSIDTAHSKVHQKRYYDFQRVFEDIANTGVLYISLRAITKEMHITVSVAAEGKARFKSYVDTTWTSDGTLGNTFNRYVDDAPDADAQIYYSGTPNVLGTQRFDTLILAGTGPQSVGATTSQRIESVLDPGHEITLEITNVSGQTKDYGVIVEWYEVDED